MNFKKIALHGFVATAALGLSVGVAQAANVNSTQIDVTHVTSTLNTTVSNTTGDITATSAALGNSLSLTTSGDYAVLNNVQESGVRRHRGAQRSRLQRDRPGERHSGRHRQLRQRQSRRRRRGQQHAAVLEGRSRAPRPT